MQARHKCSVHNKLPPPKQREAVRDDLQPLSVTRVTSDHVQIAHHDVRHDTRSFLTANTGCRAFHSEPAPSQHPQPLHKLHGGGQKNQSGRPHRQLRWVRGRGRRSRRKSKVRKKGGSMRVKKQVGPVLAPAPPWDLNEAFSLSDMMDNTTSRCCCSTWEDASCCPLSSGTPGAVALQPPRPPMKEE